MEAPVAGIGGKCGGHSVEDGAHLQPTLACLHGASSIYDQSLPPSRPSPPPEQHPPKAAVSNRVSQWVLTGSINFDAKADQEEVWAPPPGSDDGLPDYPEPNEKNHIKEAFGQDGYKSEEGNDEENEEAAPNQFLQVCELLPLLDLTFTLTSIRTPQPLPSSYCLHVFSHADRGKRPHWPALQAGQPPAAWRDGPA